MSLPRLVLPLATLLQRGAGVRRAAQRRHPAAGRRAALCLGAASLCALVACGGGGSAADPTTGTPPPVANGALTRGAITGFGSIIVNGVRFDDSAALVYDDDGQRRGRDDLRLGAQVDIESSSVDRVAGTATATTIRYGSEIVGPLASVDVAGSRLVLLGQTVAVTTTTVFDDSLRGGLAGLVPGMVLEVHAQFDAGRGVYVASRIEDKAAPAFYKLRGIVSALNTASRSFSIGAASIQYGSAGEVRAGLANGQWVKVELRTTPVAGQWVANRVLGEDRSSSADRSEVEVKGRISSYTSATQFSVDGLTVDARSASFPEGQAGVVAGALVEVEGALVNGVLVARKVSLEDSDDDHDEDFELHGSVSGHDPVAKTFVLRGLTVSYAGPVEYRDGASEASVVNGARLEVKGVLSADGTQLRATRIAVED